MINIKLTEPEAFAMLSELQIKAAQSVDDAKMAVRLGMPEVARINSTMGEQWAKLAANLQSAILTERGPRKVHVQNPPQHPSD